MRETQRNIRTYKKKLIGLKEKLATAGLLFLMSAVMLTTASFAWITLSVAPETKGIATTVAGNGNLEIALVSSNEDGTAKLPEASQVGDSNKNLVAKNITWGNLVNLNDNSYGLNKVVLRPATLNSYNLLNNPLRAVEYSKDGRINAQNYDFAYSNFNVDENSFLISDRTSYGVRAISSVTTKISATGTAGNYALWEDINTAFSDMKNDYSSNLVGNSEYINSISALMGTYLSDGLNDSKTNSVNDIRSFYSMMVYFQSIMDQLGEIYAKIINAQNKSYAWTWEALYQNPQNEAYWKKQGINIIDGYNKFISDYNGMVNAIGAVKAKLDEVDAKTRNELYVDDIISQINFFVDIGSCKIDGKYTVNGLMGDKSTAVGLVLGGGSHTGVIQIGALQRFEQLAGVKMEVKNLTIKVHYITTVRLNADISTSATTPGTLDKVILREYDGTIYNYLLSDVEVIRTAADIYGMAIDIWVRTNMADSYLILEGEPELVYEVQTTASGYIIYENEDGTQFYHIPDKSGYIPSASSIDPLQKIVNTENYLYSGTFYNVSTNQPLHFNEVTDESKNDENENGVDDSLEIFVASLKYSPKTIVVGYDGVNRIWEESIDLVEGTSTTQGNGSCFIFYPEDPLEQERMLNMLSSLSVAFIDTKGNVMARAALNPAHAYEEVGKVTVPLELLSYASSSYLNDSGEEIYYVTELTQNESTMISAIIYMDGENLSNDDVNAASSVNGYLNLQFGSSSELISIEDEDLMAEYIMATASVDKTKFEVTEIPATTNVNVEIKGVNIDNSEVELRFVRQVNDYQGVQLEPITLNVNSSTDKSSSLSGQQTFTAPGIYVLNSVWVDGIEYDLENQVSVEVEGFKINTLGWDQTSSDIYKMISSNKYDVQLTVDVAASDQFKPVKMEALFRNEYNEYMTVYMSEMGSSENGVVWSGTGSFITSGKYELQYLKINDEIYNIDSGFKKTITLVMGINATVELDYALDEQASGLSNISFEWNVDDKSLNVVDLSAVKIFDNKGNIIESLEDVSIYYGLSGSTNTNLYAELVWNSEKGAYTGKLSSDGEAAQFLIKDPGVYRFDNIFIADTSTEDNLYDGSEITAAKAPSITAISPYPIEFFENTLIVEDNQFSPDNTAPFTVDMKYSSTASVVAKMTYYGDSETNAGISYYVPGVVYNNNIETNVTGWKFVPFIGADDISDYPLDDDGKIDYSKADFNYSQDGIWKLEEFRLANVYADDGTGKYDWYSISGDNWWTSDDKSTYVTWDVEDRTTNILGTIQATAKSNDILSEKMEDVFTTSLSETYKINGFTIGYTDSIGRTINNDFLADFGLMIKSNTVTYTYSKDTEILADDGGWLDKIGSSEPSSVVSSDQAVLSFVSTDSITLKYPGTYTPSKPEVSLVYIDEDKNEVGKVTASNALNITSELKAHTVSWLRPDVRFTSYSPASKSVWTGKYNWLAFPETTPMNNSIDSNTNTINAYFGASGSGFWIVNYDEGTTATVTLTNGGSLFSVATCTLHTSSETIFTFNNGATTASDIIGKSETRNNASDRLTSAAGAECKSIVFTYGGTTYTFTLPLSLKVGENK